MRKRILHIATAFAAVFISACSANDYVNEDLPVSAEYISSIESAKMYEFCQSRGEYMWMHTDMNGLVRYDGSHLLHFDSDSTFIGGLSSEYVNDVLSDIEGTLWVATSSGVDRYDSQISGFVNIPIVDGDTYCIRLFLGNNGEVYVTTRRSVREYDAVSGTFKKVMSLPEMTDMNPIVIVDDYGKFWLNSDRSLFEYSSSFAFEKEIVFDEKIANLIPDKDNGLLILSGDKLFRVDTRTGSIAGWPSFYKGISGKSINQISLVNPGVVLFDTKAGLYCFDLSRRELYSSEDINNPYKLLLMNYDGGVSSYDTAGNYWHAPVEGGFEVIYSGNEKGRAYDTLFNYLRGHVIDDSATDGRWLWILYDERYLLTYDKDSNTIKTVSDMFELSGLAENLNKIVLSSDGRMLLNGRSRTIQTIVTYTFDENGAPVLECRYSSESSLMATFDDDGNLWGAGRTPSLMFAPKASNGVMELKFSDTGIRFQVGTMTYVSHIRTLRDNNILVAYTDSDPIIFNIPSQSIKTISIPERAQIYYYDSYEMSDGDLWLLTNGEGVYHYYRSEDSCRRIEDIAKSGRVVSYGKEDGIYISFDHKLLYYVSNNDEASVIWKDNSLLRQRKALIGLSEETIGLFSADAAYYFDLNRGGGDSEVSYPVGLTLVSAQREIASASVSADEPDRHLTFRLKSIPDDLNLKLSVKDSFSGSKYQYSFNPRNSSAAHTGEIENSSIPIYNLHLGSNRYSFKIKSVNNFGESPLYDFVIKVSYPWYYWLMMLFIILFLMAFLSLYFHNRSKQREVEKEKKEKEMQEEINRRNVDFFANMSHEFRAPLTLINGAVSEIEADKTWDEPRAQTLSIVKRNVDRMLKLVTQMLDFNKLDRGMMKLNVREADLSSVVRAACEFFEIGACQKSIDLVIKGCDEACEGYADVDKLEKIMYNLCSNALKFTPPGGNIEVLCEKTDDDILKVTVSDTGIGLPEQDTERIFDRFTQAPEARKAGGTGIGLSFTKSLVNLHHGQIEAHNIYDDTQERNIRGAQFIFSIPINKEAYTSAEFEESTDEWKAVDRDAKLSEYVLEPEETVADESKMSVLLIDDDYELVYYLKSLFSKDYNVYFRFDATSGYALIDKIHPDVIVCDMMMMDVSGLELCSMVKGNLSMCHIPFIMLTGKASVEDQVKSLNVGADAYVVKPFSPQYLTALVASMLENRTKVRGVLTTSVKTTEESSKILGAIDKEFMDKLYDIMEEGLEDSEMDFTEIAFRMGVSRSKLFYKVKSLTGQTPNDFFNTYKLNKAAEMIREGKFKISAISSMVGFNSPSHFSSLFKKKFGVLPSEYR